LVGLRRCRDIRQRGPGPPARDTALRSRSRV